MLLRPQADVSGHSGNCSSVKVHPQESHTSAPSKPPSGGGDSLQSHQSQPQPVGTEMFQHRSFLLFEGQREGSCAHLDAPVHHALRQAFRLLFGFAYPKEKKSQTSWKSPLFRGHTPIVLHLSREKIPFGTPQSILQSQAVI